MDYKQFAIDNMWAQSPLNKGQYTMKAPFRVIVTRNDTVLVQAAGKLGIFQIVPGFDENGKANSYFIINPEDTKYFNEEVQEQFEKITGGL